MKKYRLLVCLVILITCKRAENSKEIRIEQSVTKKNAEAEKPQNFKRQKLSKIINSKFDLKLLFGIWTYNQNGPNADFELTKKSFYVVDHDGNGDMPYIINQDTLKVYFEDYVSVGIIKSVTKDTLKIDWDKKGIINCVKWKR